MCLKTLEVSGLPFFLITFCGFLRVMMMLLSFLLWLLIAIYPIQHPYLVNVFYFVYFVHKVLIAIK